MYYLILTPNLGIRLRFTKQESVLTSKVLKRKKAVPPLARTSASVCHLYREATALPDCIRTGLPAASKPKHAKNVEVLPTKGPAHAERMRDVTHGTPQTQGPSHSARSRQSEEDGRDFPPADPRPAITGTRFCCGEKTH